MGKTNAQKYEEVFGFPPFKPGDPYTRQVVYLTTQKGYEIDLKCLDDLEQGCGTCKYINKGICEEPCSSCDIRLGNNKWEPEEEDGDKL